MSLVSRNGWKGCDVYVRPKDLADIPRSEAPHEGVETLIIYCLSLRTGRLHVLFIADRRRFSGQIIVLLYSLCVYLLRLNEVYL